MNRALKDAANEELSGILAFSEEPLVSSDFKRNSNSSIVDAEYTKVINGRLVKVLVLVRQRVGLFLPRARPRSSILRLKDCNLSVQYAGVVSEQSSQLMLRTAHTAHSPHCSLWQSFPSKTST